MPSKRNKKTKILTKSRNFREKKAQAIIDNESDGSFSDEEYQPEPLGAAHIPRDSDSDPEELPRRNKVFFTLFLIVLISVFIIMHKAEWTLQNNE